MQAKISKKIELKHTQFMGKGFFAKQYICQGEELLSIDEQQFITFNRLEQFAQFFYTGQSEISNISLFSFYLAAVSIIRKDHLQQDHRDIHQYINDLPQVMHGLINWSEQQLDIINNKSIVGLVRQKKKKMKKEYQGIIKIAKKFWQTSKMIKGQYRLFSCKQQINNVTFDKFVYFYSVIESRSVHYACSQDVGALAPLLEIFNHSENPQCTVQGDQTYKVKSIRQINKDEQIFVSYGRNNIQKFLQLYGFLPFIQNPISQDANYRNKIAFEYNKYFRENPIIQEQLIQEL